MAASRMLKLGARRRAVITLPQWRSCRMRVHHALVDLPAPFGDRRKYTSTAIITMARRRGTDSLAATAAAAAATAASATAAAASDVAKTKADAAASPSSEGGRRR